MATPALGPFDSAWMKWYRAVALSETIRHEIERFAPTAQRGSPISLAAEYNSRRHAFVVTVDSVETFPPRWHLCFGEIVFNFRCALDHLAWALVLRGTTPPSTLKPGQQTVITFPICRTRKAFDAALVDTQKHPSRLPGLRARDLALVRRYQPYRRGEARGAGQHPLWLLSRFNNLDKHRHVAPLWGVPRFAKFYISEWDGCDLTFKDRPVRSRPLEVGAEVRTVRVRKTGPKPEMKIQGDFTAHVCTNDGTPVLELFDDCRILIDRLLSKCAEPPEHLFAKLDI